MRAVFLMAGLAAFATAAQAEDWIAVCFGQDAQYTQSVGGAGFFHIPNANGTYDTQKLVQVFFDGNTLCGMADPKAPRALSEVAEVCVDKTRKTISVLKQSEVGKRITPQNAQFLCKARVSVF